MSQSALRMWWQFRPVTLIRTGPRDVMADAGAGAAFAVTATGPGVLTYQWIQNSSVLEGATSATLQLANLDSTNAGTYAVVVSSFAGSVTSAPALLTVL